MDRVANRIRLAAINSGVAGEQLIAACEVVADAALSLDRRMEETVVRQGATMLSDSHVRRLAASASAGADKRIYELAGSQGWVGMLSVTVVALLGAAVAGGVGYSIGWRTALTQTAPLAQLAPYKAEAWATLIAGNDITSAMAACRAHRTRLPDGRETCQMPVWLDQQPFPSGAPVR